MVVGGGGGGGGGCCSHERMPLVPLGWYQSFDLALFVYSIKVVLDNAGVILFDRDTCLYCIVLEVFKLII